MEKTNESIVRYLSRAKTFIAKALLKVKENDEQSAQKHIRKAIHMLKIADKLMIQKHITVCIPKMIRATSSNNVVDEIMKTYKYVSS